MVPLHRIDVGTRGRGVAKGARVPRLHGGVEQLHGVAAARRQQRRHLTDPQKICRFPSTPKKKVCVWGKCGEWDLRAF